MDSKCLQIQTDRYLARPVNSRPSPRSPRSATSSDSTHSNSSVRIVPFRWVHGGRRVILTGDFDDWKQKIEMTEVYDGEFEAYLQLDRSRPWQFKFLVDGQWRCALDQNTCYDQHGMVNNVLNPE
ncbi:immunoglobulin E-set [Polychytrium aggregatum]|uniref:immunoglobulin E-set n=1 Tax=Polychytrium aggregatum TaxID=110093 RepID=UPI0022FF2AB8|nr:immunoglobulin E-set [Polychytrium aggregatum]KAI9197191.1 immunoglobulin E-set [Polychytrium aggregatum]